MEVKEILYRFIYDIQDDELQKLNTILSRTKKDAGNTRSVIENLYNILEDTPDIEEPEDEHSSISVPVDFDFNIPEIDIGKPDIGELESVEGDGPDSTVVSPAPSPQADMEQPDREIESDERLFESMTDITPEFNADVSNTLMSDQLDIPDISAENYPDVDMNTSNRQRYDIDSRMSIDENITHDSRILEISNELSNSFNRAVDNTVQSILTTENQRDENISIQNDIQRDIIAPDSDTTENVFEDIIEGSASVAMDIDDQDRNFELDIRMDGSIEVNYDEVDQDGPDEPVNNEYIDSIINQNISGIDNEIEMDLNRTNESVLTAENQTDIMMEERNRQDTMIHRNTRVNRQEIYQEKNEANRRGRTRGGDRERDIISEVISAIESMTIDYGLDMRDPMEAQKETRRYVDRTVHTKLQDIYRNVRR